MSSDAIRVQPGTYPELVRVIGKSDLVVEGDPAGAPGSAVIEPPTQPALADCLLGAAAVEIAGSSGITLRRIAVHGYEGYGVRLRGGAQTNGQVQIVGMRVVGNGRPECGGGILIEQGNPETLLAHNLIHANRRDGVVFQSPPSLGPAVPQNLWSNTIYGNGRHGVRVSGAERPYLWNNLIVGNGADPALQPSFGLVRDLTGVVAPVAGSAMGLWHNLICGNRNGEVLPAPLEIPDTAGNQTPTGSEGAGYVASPQCAEPSTLFEGGEGRDFVWGSLDDDFFLRRTAPAVDAGTAPPTPAPDLATLEGDYYEPVSVRPADGNGDWTSEYDIGALEWGPPVKRNLPPHLSRVRRIPQISQ